MVRKTRIRQELRRSSPHKPSPEF
ncbi:hypothetical protein CCACVL1_22381 [Corchorus capsularis]|uniref:Uncharacterized protein n=1 Tax=Corchorus capsularis TaxID=210143 RepID=A0A1R3GZR8_COCAP|nr:hypothetical protein CCACVL1_22381 [Corchorus capsularis]